METYRLSSKLTSANREIVIQTSNDAAVSAIQSTIFVDGQPADISRTRHPGEWNSEDILAMVKSRHTEKKDELEMMLRAYEVVLKSGDAKSLYELGIAFFYKRLYPEAQRLFEAAIALDPKFSSAYNYLSRTFGAMKLYEQSLTAAKEALTQKPHYADFRFTLGQAFLAVGRYADAVAEFEQAVKINTYYGDAYFCLGLALLLNGINQKETELFDSVISRSADNFKRAGIIEANYEGEMFAEGFKLLEEQDMEAAYHLFKKVYDARRRERFQDLSTYYMKYVHLYGEITPETLDRRIEYLKDEVKKHPDYADLHLELARLQLRKSKTAWENSISSYQTALDINSNLAKVDTILSELDRGLDVIEDTIARVTKE